MVATDATRASRDCCSEVNAAAAWARNASNRYLDLLLRLGRRRLVRNGEQTSARNSTTQ
ncbi:MAG: hypothetical protein WA754_25900 [Pseudolabrys sp.]